MRHKSGSTFEFRRMVSSVLAEPATAQGEARYRAIERQGGKLRRGRNRTT